MAIQHFSNVIFELCEQDELTQRLARLRQL